MMNNNNDWDNDDINKEFVESTTSKLLHRKEPVNKVTYSQEEVKSFYLYPLLSLMGHSIKKGIQVSSKK